MLARRGVRATFFLVGEQVLRNPSIPAEILAAGHAIGLHCHRHRNLLRLSPWQVREDLRAHKRRSRMPPASSPMLYRPPYGMLNATRCALRGKRGDARCCGPTGDATGKQRATPESIAARLTDGVEEGSILLLHDADDYSAPGSWRRTVLRIAARA